jgi:hypothetical protein
MIVQIEDEVLAHDGQADETEICLVQRCSSESDGDEELAVVTVCP